MGKPLFGHLMQLTDTASTAHGKAGGDLQGTYPNPTINPASLPWTPSGTTLTPTDATKNIVALPGDATAATVLLGSTTAKGRVQAVASNPGMIGLFANRNVAAANAQDDATRPSWGLMHNMGADQLIVQRSPAGSTTQTTLLMLDANGYLTVGASTVNGKLFLAPRGTIYAAGGSTTNVEMTCNADSTVPGYDQSTAGWTWRLGSGPGNDWCNLYRRAGGSATFTAAPVMTADSVGNFAISGSVATKASGTTWANPSDRRLKDAIEDYVTGLDAILQLQPRTFVYNGKGGSTAGLRGYGFVADEVRPVMPETISVRAAKLDPDDADDTDIQTLDQSNLILALVNAVKELATRVAALEGKV